MRLLLALVPLAVAVLATPALAREDGSDLDLAGEPVTFLPDNGEVRGFLGRMEARPFTRLSFFAERTEYPLGVRIRTYDLEGGAVYRLAHRLRLVGGFRLRDYELAPSGTNLRAQHAGAYLGLSFSF